MILHYMIYYMYEMIHMNTYIHGRTNVYNINDHIVWCIKYRRKVLNAQLLDRLYELVKSVGDEKGFIEYCYL